MENQIDKFFKSHLDSAELGVESSTWGKLEQRLTGKKHTRLPIFAAAAMVIFTLVAGFWLMERSGSPEVSIPIVKEEVKAKMITPPEISKQEAANFINELAEKVETSGYTNFTESKVSEPDHRVVEQESPQQIPGNAAEMFSSAEKIDVLENPELSTVSEQNFYERDIIIYEFIAEPDDFKQERQKSKIIKTIADVKRDGISFGAIKEIKEELVNRLLRNPQRMSDKKQKLKQS